MTALIYATLILMIITLLLICMVCVMEIKGRVSGMTNDKFEKFMACVLIIAMAIVVISAAFRVSLWIFGL